MAFVKKEWKDRLVEFAGRRLLTRVSGSAENQIVVDVNRSEGVVSQEGDAFSASNMNDLEQRIGDEFETLNNDLQQCFQSASEGKKLLAATLTGLGINTAANATFAQINNNIKTLATSRYNAGYNYGYNVGYNAGAASAQAVNITVTGRMGYSDSGGTYGVTSLVIYYNPQTRSASLIYPASVGSNVGNIGFPLTNFDYGVSVS